MCSAPSVLCETKTELHLKYLLCLLSSYFIEKQLLAPLLHKVTTFASFYGCYLMRRASNSRFTRKTSKTFPKTSTYMRKHVSQRFVCFCFAFFLSLHRQSCRMMSHPNHQKSKDWKVRPSLHLAIRGRHMTLVNCRAGKTFLMVLLKILCLCLCRAD